MATTETDRVFKSYSRNMDQQTTRTPGGSRGVTNRRVYEDSETRSTAGRFNRERNESPSSTTRNTTSSVTNRFNKMTIEDIDKDDDKGREEVNDEEMPSARSRLKKDAGARSRGDDNDGENEEGGDEEDAPKKSLKKATANAGAAKRRKEKKNLREKRRSTGVVIMPGQAVDPSDEQAQTVAKNTAANMADPGSEGAASNADVLNYQETIMQLQDELAAKVKELDSLRNQMDTLQKAHTRLKDENSALLRVVGSLSGTGSGR